MSIKKGLIYAIIPARSGSTSVVHKNVRMLAGHPLISYSIGIGKIVTKIDRVIVSTDSEEYAIIAKKYGAEVPFLRPAEISGKYSTDYEFMDHAIRWLEDNEGILPEYWVHLRPTAPLRDPFIVEKAIDLIIADDSATSLRSAHSTLFCPHKWFKKDSEGYFETYDGISLDYANSPRQSFPTTYIPNGYVDILKTDYIMKHKQIHGTKMIGYIVPETIDIDYEQDFCELQRNVSSFAGPLYQWLNQRMNVL